MKKEYLKTAQLRDHLANKYGEHTVGNWSKCPVCSNVYRAVTPRFEQANNRFYTPPINLVAVMRSDTGATVYIQRKDLPPNAGGIIPIFKKSGYPVLVQRNREAKYTQAVMPRDAITPPAEFTPPIERNESPKLHVSRSWANHHLNQNPDGNSIMPNENWFLY